MEFKSVGITYHNAPLSVRESVALSSNEVNDFLLRLRDAFGLSEALVVSTCNRTEVYYSSPEDLTFDVMSLLAAQKSVYADDLRDYWRSYDGPDSVHHLFEVALGLDSQVLGDIQISNQIKKAYQASADLDLAGPFLHRLMHTIFYANKRVVQETRLQDGNASLASVSVDLIKRFIENIADPKIVIVGLGEIGENVLENLGGIDSQITLINRTKSKAEELATEANVKVGDFSDRQVLLGEADVVVSAIAASEDVYEAENFESSKYQHKLLIDLGVPRSLPEVAGLAAGVSLYNVDQLTERTQKARKIREASVPEVKEIIKESVAGFDDWREEIGVSPTIQKLKKTLDDIRQQELARHIGKVSEEEMELLEVVTKNMIQKVIKLPVLQLKAACRRGESENIVGVLNDLFNLEADEKKSAE